jgi:hypothetical protein
VGEILLYFYVPMYPMERFYDGTDQENSKKQEGKNGGKKKKRFFFFTNLEVPILVCSPSVSQEHPWATALVQPFLRREPTCMGTSPTTMSLWVVMDIEGFS